ncbi:MAG: ABC transporter substrate-binding protein [Tetrasphaera sp.]
MTLRPSRRASTLLLAGLTAATLVACSPPSKESSGSSTSGGSGGGDAASATSAAALGGLDKLVEAAKKEGTLNVIALPPDWANYGAIIKAFEAKYGVKVVSDQPDADSATEIATAERLKGQSKAPDVFDLGGVVALANTDKYAAYQVERFDEIPAQYKDPNGLWVNDYGGYMAIGYDSAKVPAITSVDDLLKPEFKGKVALNGDPLKAAAGFAGVQMVSLAKGGTLDDITKAVDFFGELKKAGNLIPVDPTSATVESGATPVVINWDYLNAAHTAKVPSWKVWVPDNAIVAGYYFQAINKDAPHPAAARLWQEFLYSDEGQNLWLNGGARPVLMDAMTKAGTIDTSAADKLPKAVGEPMVSTTEQTDKAKAYLTANWAKAVG